MLLYKIHPSFFLHFIHEDNVVNKGKKSRRIKCAEYFQALHVHLKHHSDMFLLVVTVRQVCVELKVCVSLWEIRVESPDYKSTHWA